MKFFISRSGLEYITRHLDREKFYNLLSDRLKKLQNFEIEQKKEFFVSKLTVTVKEVNTGFGCELRSSKAGANQRT